MAVILVKADTITPTLQKLSQYFKGRQLHNRVAQAALNDTRAFFFDKQSRFWSGIGSAWANTTDTAQGNPRISVQGDKAKILLHKINGGTIYPTSPRKNLAIPANAQARAAGSPSEGDTPPLRPGCWGRDRKPHALVTFDDNFKKHKKKWGMASKFKGVIWYWLVKFVNQQPDPDAMPSEERTLEAVREAANESIQAAIQAALSK